MEVHEVPGTVVFVGAPYSLEKTLPCKTHHKLSMNFLLEKWGVPLLSGPISIIPKPELLGFWGGFPYFSPPFRVTNRRLGRDLICPDCYVSLPECTPKTSKKSPHWTKWPSNLPSKVNPNEKTSLFVSPGRFYPVFTLYMTCKQTWLAGKSPSLRRDTSSNGWFSIFKVSFLGVYSFEQLLKITLQNSKPKTTSAWYSKQPVFNGCFNWIIQNHYIIKIVVSPFPSIKIWLFRVPGDCLQSRKICFAHSASLSAEGANWRRIKATEVEKATGRCEGKKHPASHRSQGLNSLYWGWSSNL